MDTIRRMRRHRLLRALMEAGFSGTITDKRGRKLTYRDGKRVTAARPAPGQKNNSKPKPKARAIDHAAVHARVQKAAARVGAALARHAQRQKSAGAQVYQARVALAAAKRSRKPAKIAAAQNRLFKAASNEAALRTKGKQLRAAVTAHGRLEKLAAANVQQKPTAAPSPSPRPTALPRQQQAARTPHPREEDAEQLRSALQAAQNHHSDLETRAGKYGPMAALPGSLRAELDRAERNVAHFQKQYDRARDEAHRATFVGPHREDRPKKKRFWGLLGGRGTRPTRKRKRRLLEQKQTRRGRNLIILALTEAGFTGTITDKRGRRIHFVGGKRVKGSGRKRQGSGK
ncbi:MAG: hypothetical protein IT429_17055 [Gemmataceae bacterium]|nr:hypothetical protein [Gemmataceae bacterium]